MNKSNILVAVLMLAIGLGAGYWLFGSGSSTEAVTAQSKKPLYYRNPMNPVITSPLPAKDSMGMDYVPVYAATEDRQVTGTVTIDPVVVQSIGVRTAIARKQSISRTIREVGRVDFDEERMAAKRLKVGKGFDQNRGLTDSGVQRHAGV